MMRQLSKIMNMLSGLIFLSCATKPPPQNELQTPSHVDLQQYLGIWYEIASIPQRFQKQCVANTQAAYSQSNDGSIAILNSCERADGSRSQAKGRAQVVDAQSQAKLKVTFVRWFGFWIPLFGGAYWIIDLEPNYQYTVVGHPERRYGWILSRSPELSNGNFKKVAEHLKAQGYDLCDFNMTPQEGGFAADKISHCDYIKSL